MEGSTHPAIGYSALSEEREREKAVLENEEHGPR